MRRDRLSTGLLVPALLLISTLAPVQPAQALTLNASIAGFAFTPSTLSIHEGDTVTWQNNDQVLHTLWTVKNSDQSTFNLSPPLLPGDTHSLAFPSSSCGAYTVYSFQNLWVTQTLNVLVQGDVNGDNIVNIFDLVSAAVAFGKSTGQPGFNPDADLNGDGTINILDLVIIGINFQEVCPSP